MTAQAMDDNRQPVSRTLQGIGVSPGIAAARVLVMKRHAWRAGWRHLPDDHVEKEVERFLLAIRTAGVELAQLREKLAADLADALSIIDSHLLMLKDKMIVGASARSAANFSRSCASSTPAVRMARRNRSTSFSTWSSGRCRQPARQA
jgi:phosphoenolpyruvate-protein kinase (PTS system EI component)